MQNNIRGYDIIKQISTGGFGEVYLARQPIINREVAIKVILPLYANRDDFINNFQLEAELVAKLENPHIVPLYDFWRDPTGAYLVMRYIRGGSLADRLVTSGALDLQLAGRLLEQIAGALHTAHRNRVIHQDIKPANILLDEDDNAYLTDFGIARDIDANVNLAQDNTNTMHGSPKYISPEHLRRREITPRSDIYSLGILMYEVLTGHAPFEHEDMLQLLQQHIRNDLPSLQTHKPDLPQALNMPLQQATLKDPMMRYGSVLDFARDFQSILQSENQGITGAINVPSEWALENTGPIEIRNPYKGLNAFKESDADDFYGRDELVKSLKQSMVAKPPEGRFLAIVGASGSGKSSVVRAGLIPSIRARAIEGLPPLYTTTMIPGENPMRSLEGAILRVASRASVSMMQTIAKDEYDLNEALEQSLPKEGEMLLLIDQFEELFTMIDEDNPKRTQFLDHIYNALMAPESRLRVIATLRADFLDHPLVYPEWGQLFRERMELIPPMSQSEVRSAIEDPATANGLEFETGLSAMLLADVAKENGALPLLQYTLHELYERRNGIEMTIEAYEEMGGISGALAKRAEEIYLTLNAEQRDIARLVFTRLVRIGERQEHTRQRILLGELYTLERDRGQIETVINTYDKYRLLTFDNETSSRLPTVEIAHEALIRSWDLLRGWIADNADALRLQARLSEAAKLWEESKEDSSYLATGSRLEQFKTLQNNQMVALTAAESEYLAESVKAEAEELARAKRRRQFINGLQATIAVLGVIAIIAAVFAVLERNDAIIARNEEEAARELADSNAQESRARELAAASLLYAENQPDRGMLLALESIEMRNTFEGQNALLTSLLTQGRLSAYFNGHDDFVRSVDVSPDGTLLATGGRDGTMIIWNRSTQIPLFTSNLHDGRVNEVRFSPDGSQVLSTDSNGQIFIWDTSSGDRIRSIETDGEEIRAASFSPDGEVLAVANSSGSVTWYDTSDFSAIASETGHDSGVIYDLDYSPDGTILATGGDDNTIHIWNATDYSLQQVIPAHSDWVLSLTFSPDGSLLASGSVDQSVAVWVVATGERRWSANAHGAEVFGLTFTDNGAFLVSGALDDFVIFWNAQTGTALTSLPTFDRTGIRDLASLGNQLYIVGDANDVLEVNIRFVPRFGETIASVTEDVLTVAINDEDTVAFAGGTAEDFSVYVQEADADSPSALELHTALVTSVAWSGERLISASIDQQVGIWEESALLGIIQPSDSIFSVAVHENTLALGTNRGIIEVWDISGDENEWSQINTLEGHSNRISDLAFNADGTRLISGSRDEAVIIWDMETGTMLYEPHTNHSDAVETVAFHPTLPIAASGSRDETIILWDVETGEPLGPALVRHENWVNDIAFSPDGSLMVSVSGDRSVILWDTSQQRALGMPFIGHTNWVNSVDFAADGKTIVTSGRDGNVFQWQVDLETWQATACDIINRPLTDGEIRDFFNESYPPANICNS